MLVYKYTTLNFFIKPRKFAEIWHFYGTAGLYVENIFPLNNGSAPAMVLVSIEYSAAPSLFTQLTVRVIVL